MSCTLADYTTVTELPGIRASKEQFAIMFHRYHTAFLQCDNKDVLEVGCGSGMGLGYLAQRARSVVGGDYSEATVRVARQHYAGKLPLLRLDAQRLPFSDSSFDLIVLFEAIYYLPEPEDFLLECRRILRRPGRLLLCSVNPDWEDFNPSPFSTRYFSAQQLAALLSRHGFAVQMFGAFQTSSSAAKDKVVSSLKRTAVRFHLIPKTMKGKEKLKRLFFGELLPLPAEIHGGLAEYSSLAPIPASSPNSDYKILYATADLN